ncbi:transporter-domain-containing protein [Tuber indicum]|nr:transporter-domain-containing protein [Tuber indicum]
MPATLILYTLDLAAGTALFGWNLAELNAPQRAIQDNLGLYAAQFGIATKSPLKNFHFVLYGGLASSVLAIGGLVGSVLASRAMNAFGRKKVLISSASVSLGGMAAGTAAVIVPMYINELAPPNYKSAFGALTQISINLGFLSSQVLGVFLVAHHPSGWGVDRFAASSSTHVIPESPSFLVAKGDIELARRELIKIRGAEDVEQELAGFHTQHAGEPEGTDGTEPVGESDPLLEHLNGKYAGNYSTSSVGDNDVSLKAGLNPESVNREIGLLQFLTKKEYRAGFIVVAGLMLAQQLTVYQTLGINAVVFYGVSILDELFPDSAKYLNAGISAVNVFVTLLASLLFHGVSNMACSSLP